MAKAFVPLVKVPGATRAMEEDGVTQKRDRKGRPIWDMPDPVKDKHPVIQIKSRRTVIEGKVRVRKVRKRAFVPVYRGLSSEDYRYLRSQFRRQQARLEAEAAAREAEEGKLKKAKDFLSNLVLTQGHEVPEELNNE